MSQRKAKTDRKSAAYRERLDQHRMRIKIAWLARQIRNQEELDTILGDLQGAQRQSVFDTYRPFLRFSNPTCFQEDSST